MTPVSKLASAWEAAPAVLAGAALASALFVQGFIRLRRRGRTDHVGWSRAVLFFLGLAVLVLALVSPLDTHVSNATLGTETNFWEVLADQDAQVERDGGLFTFKVEYARYPHIVLRQDEYLFTSVHLTLQKRARI